MQLTFKFLKEFYLDNLKADKPIARPWKSAYAPYALEHVLNAIGSFNAVMAKDLSEFRRESCHTAD